MDACTELQSQSVPFSDITVIQKDLRVEDMSTGNSESMESTDDVPLILPTAKEVLSNEPVLPNLLTDPTSTPEETVYPNTPQTSPPHPTPLKVTLSNTEIANIAHTSSIMSSLTSDSVCTSSYELPFSMSESSIQLPNRELGLETRTGTETTRTLKENNSVQFPESPRKARIVDAKPQTPNRNQQYSKVSRPFRPPSSLKSERSISDAAIILGSPKTPVPSSIRFDPKKSSTNNQPGSNKLHTKTYHTLAVSKPFKSPFRSPLSSLSSVTNKSTLSPNIQALEKKVTMLRRAIKLTADKEDEKLKDLVCKWTLAGREVSWELWSVMKERGPGDAMTWSEGSRFNDSWSWGVNRNWESEERTEESRVEENSARLPFEAEMWNSINIQNSIKRQEAEHNKVSPHTLGAMLRSYGITNDILGWNDDEEDFNQLE